MPFIVQLIRKMVMMIRREKAQKRAAQKEQSERNEKYEQEN
jgi:hypothetical protein